MRWVEKKDDRMGFPVVEWMAGMTVLLKAEMLVFELVAEMVAWTDAVLAEMTAAWSDVK